MNSPWRNLEPSNLFERIRKWRDGISTSIITVVVNGFSEKVCQQSILARTWESLLEWLYAWSHTMWKVQRQVFQTFPKTSESEGRKQKSLWLVWSQSLTSSCKPKMSRSGLEKYLLHSCVGCTADVPGDHRQAAWMEAWHQRSQIELEPLLKVFRLKFVKFGSQGSQGQVQHCVSYIIIFDEGHFFLEIKGFTFQLRRTFYISGIIVRRTTSSVMPLCTSVHQRLRLKPSHCLWQFIQEAYQKCIIFSQILAPI